MSADFFYTPPGPKREPGRRRLDLTLREQVVVVGALQRDLQAPESDHETLRALLVRLAS
jgi:hypothetical protein